MSGLCVRELTVRFGDRVAVNAANLSLDAGVVALLGPSGCGKSTLLRAIAGLEPATGTITWDGVDLAGRPPHRRRFGLMFQDGQLFPYRNVAANVDYGLAIARVPRAQRVARTAELLDLVGLGGYQRRSIETLSGGERQRVALARALAPRPVLLMLDEPLTALDRQLREHLAGEIRRILTQAGQAAIFVTHDQEEAFTVADQVAVMTAGTVAQQDAAEQVWRHPINRQVARFLGYRWFCPAEDGAPGSGPHLVPEAGAGAEADADAGSPRPVLALAAGSVRVVSKPAEWTGTVVGPPQFTRAGTRVPVLVPALGPEPIPAQAPQAVSGEVFVALDRDRTALISPEPADRSVPPRPTADVPTVRTGRR